MSFYIRLILEIIIAYIWAFEKLAEYHIDDKILFVSSFIMLHTIVNNKDENTVDYYIENFLVYCSFPIIVFTYLFRPIKLFCVEIMLLRNMKYVSSNMFIQQNKVNNKFMLIICNGLTVEYIENVIIRYNWVKQELNISEQDSWLLHDINRDVLNKYDHVFAVLKKNELFSSKFST